MHIYSGARRRERWRTVVSDVDTPESALRPGRYIALWLLLALISAILVTVPELPVAIYEPHLSAAVGAVAGVIGLALLQLGLLRFRLLHRTLDLHAGLAFGVLALGNLFDVWASGPTEAGKLRLDTSIYLLLLSRATAAVLFLTGFTLTIAGRPTAGSAAAVIRWLAAGCALVVWMIIAFGAHLPPLLDQQALELLNETRPITDLLPGQAPGLIAANSAIAAALAIAAVGYAVAARKLLDPYFGALATALAMLVFAQLQAVLIPAMASDYVVSGDAFRLAAYGLLLSNLIWRTVADIADRTVHQERLRLSRELHDGLAQQLALLHLRIGRAAEFDRPVNEVARDLQIAQRLVETASLEARQAIVALRSERVSWDAMTQVLATFGDEFEQNHGVDISVAVESDNGLASVDSVLQGELLQILHEAFSNAIRHGGAQRVRVNVAAQHRMLNLMIRDDGRGFDIAQTTHGLGLRSMSERVVQRGGAITLDTSPGLGTTIYVSLPIETSESGKLPARLIRVRSQR